MLIFVYLLVQEPCQGSDQGDFSVNLRFICLYCGRKDDKPNSPFVFHTGQYSKLSTHCKEVHKGLPFKYMRTLRVKCFQCEMTFSLSDFRSHTLEKHGANYMAIVGVNVCTLCYDHSNFREEILEHVKNKHRAIVPENHITSQLVCLLCGKKEDYRSNSMMNHVCPRQQRERDLTSEIIPIIDLSPASKDEHEGKKFIFLIVTIDRRFEA
jgi:hypothetical protein